jgi:hypothetical protein
MKAKFVTMICVVALTFLSTTPGFAQDDDGPLTAVADTVVVRPACFVATVLGSAFFVVSLPFAAMSKSVKKTAHALVVKPAKAAFTRPVGDMDALIDY